MTAATRAPAATERDYEGLFVRWERLYRRAHYGQVHIRGRDVPVVDSRQGTSQFYVMPQFEELALTQWVIFVRDHTGVPSGRHTHQGGIAIFGIEGDGFSVVNGRRFDWSAEDAVLLPIVPGGLDHQHFRARADRPSKFMGIIYEPLVVGLGAEMVQLEPQTRQSEWAPATDAGAKGDGAMVAATEPTLAGLVAMRERQRAALRPPALIRRVDLAVDDTPFGELRWYCHPAARGFAGTAPMFLFTQRLAPGRATDVLATPGNGIMFVLEGDPTIELDGEAYRCERTDMVLVPPRRDGVTIAVRAGARESRIVIALANLSGLAGLAMGADLALRTRGA
jgi:quercetin dioxygenase-like cupin family protein